MTQPVPIQSRTTGAMPTCHAKCHAKAHRSCGQVARLVVDRSLVANLSSFRPFANEFQGLLRIHTNGDQPRRHLSVDAGLGLVQFGGLDWSSVTVA
jgi:hypothetical protein